MGARVLASMPKQNQDKSTENLERRIDELVASMGTATQKLTEEFANAERPDDQFETEAMIASAMQAKPKAPQAAPSTPPSLDDQVDKMISQAAASAPAADAVATVDSIDGQLSSLADELLDGDLDHADAFITPPIAKATPEEQPPPEPAADAADDSIDDDHLLDGDFGDLDDVIAMGESQPPPPPKPKPQPASDAAPAPAPKAAPEAPAPAPKPVATPSPAAPAPQPESAPAPQADRAVTHDKKRTKSPAAGKRLRVVAQHAGNTAYALAERLTKPLDTRPSQLKDITGWLAAVTLFNAVAVWAFLLIGRGPAPGASDEPAVELVKQPATADASSDEID